MKSWWILLVTLPMWSIGQSKKNDYFAITFENDAIALPGLTDKHYTNGLRFEGIGSRHANKNFLLNKALIKLKGDSVDYMFGSFFGQNLYTPRHLDSVNVQRHDRPYAAWLYAGIKIISTDLKKKRRLTSELYLGIIGPHAFGGEVQTFIHKVFPSTIPLGWKHQIDSDLGINYVLRHERSLVGLPSRNSNSKNIAELIWINEVNAGTVFNNISTGGMIRVGWMTPYLGSYNFGSGPIIKLRGSTESRKSKPKFRCVSQLFLFARPQVRAVLCNSLLQGGRLNRTSEYVVPPENLTRVVTQLDYGFGITLRSFTLAYTQSIRSKEFSYSNIRNHYWGGVNFIFNY
jgi:lipid A 3-O-deacylase